jgi:pimeloyl-ACP methyl ester carboxylesterase
MDATGAADRENPAVLAGSSLGALAAESAAFKRPDMVKAIVLLDGCFPMTGGVNRGLLVLSLPLIGKKWYRSFRRNHEGAWASLAPYYHDLEALPGADKKFLRERVIVRVESPAQERAYFASLRSLIRAGLFQGAGFSRRIRRLPAGLLLLWGAEDRVLAPGTAGKIRTIRPDAAYVEIPGAGHLPHQEKPAETAVAILDFLKTLP